MLIDILTKLTIFGVIGVIIILLVTFVWILVEDNCYEEYLKRIGVR